MADSTPIPASSSRAGRLGQLYASCLRAAQWVHVHRRVAGAVGAPLALLVIAATGQVVLLDFPNSGDEYAYLYQAQTFAAGRLWNAAVAPAEIFAFSYIVQEPGRTFSSFPIGWPLLLALAQALRVPVWLVNPLLGVVTLSLVWALGARLHTPRVGVIAAVLVAVSPFFVFNCASYFSHPLCGALVLGAACLAAREDRASWWVPVSVGLLLGWAVLARYFTGVVCAVPIVLWLLRPGVNRPRTAALVGLGTVPWIALLMAYNTAMSGSPWRLTTTPITTSHWFADGFVLRGADILSTHIVRHLLWTPPGLIVAYLVYLRVAPPEARRGALDWMLVVMAGLLFFYVERGGNQYGPRFHYEAFLFLVPFVAANVFREDDYAEKTPLGRAMFALLAVSVALMPLWFVGHAAVERQVIRERMDPYTMASAAGLHHALVLIGGRVGTVRSMAALDLTRNPIDHQANVLYGLDPGEGARCATGVQVPGRTTYVYAWDRAKSHGVLRPLECQ